MWRILCQYSVFIVLCEELLTPGGTRGGLAQKDCCNASWWATEHWAQSGVTARAHLLSLPFLPHFIYELPPSPSRFLFSGCRRRGGRSQTHNKCRCLPLILRKVLPAALRRRVVCRNPTAPFTRKLPPLLTLMNRLTCARRDSNPHSRWF